MMTVSFNLLKYDSINRGITWIVFHNRAQKRPLGKKKRNPSLSCLIPHKQMSQLGRERECVGM